jgi:hypothetical protein
LRDDILSLLHERNKLLAQQGDILQTLCNEGRLCLSDLQSGFTARLEEIMIRMNDLRDEYDQLEMESSRLAAEVARRMGVDLRQWESMLPDTEVTRESRELLHRRSVLFEENLEQMGRCSIILERIEKEVERDIEEIVRMRKIMGRMH